MRLKKWSLIFQVQPSIRASGHQSFAGAAELRGFSRFWAVGLWVCGSMDLEASIARNRGSAPIYTSACRWRLTQIQRAVVHAEPSAPRRPEGCVPHQATGRKLDCGN
jgi:hypothetical protein